MKRIVLLIIVLLALWVFPALAQDNTVSFDGYSFSFPATIASNVAISQFPGDAPTLEQPGGTQVKHTEFLFYNNITPPANAYDGVGYIQVFNTADFAAYDTVNQQFTALQTLLAQRPDLSPFMAADPNSNADDLPFIPIQNAAQVIRGQIHFLDTPVLQGISFVTVFRQDVSPFTGSEFIYSFQGITSDGSTYVSAIFPLNTALFPAEIPPDFDYDTFNAQFADYLNQSVATLNAATPDQFTPSPAALDALIQSFTMGGAVQPPVAATLLPATVAPATVLPAATVPPTIQPTVTIANSVMGGLAGITWTLVSFGNPAAPTPALPDRPLTLTFSGTGVSGNAGCNSFSGGFQFQDNTLTIGPLVRTLMACDQPIMEQEDAFVTALQAATSFQINGSQLQISYNGGVLTFNAS